MVCPQCGKRYPPGAELCQNDGSRLSQLAEDPYIGYQIANFQLQKQIGRGGFGLVYLATHNDLGTEVAIKILRKQYTTDEQLVERFKREARVSSQLRHPNVVQISDFGFDQNIGFYYVMEYLNGISLSQVMKEYSRGMNVDRMLPILKQICSALDQAHSQNVVHRDLKPSNILLIEYFGQTDKVKILDFGIAKVLQAEESQGVTATGQIVGSPRFMSPEQARGRHNEVDPRSDIYALGVMIFWMLTGRLPFESKQLARLLFMHIKAPPPTLNSIRSAPHFTPQLEAVVAAALSKDKASRPSTAGDLYSRLEKACLSKPEPQSRPLLDPFAADLDDRTVRIALPEKRPSHSALPASSTVLETPNSFKMVQEGPDTSEDPHTIDANRALFNSHDDDDESNQTTVENINHIHQLLDEREASRAMLSATALSPLPPSSTAPPSSPSWNSLPQPPTTPPFPNAYDDSEEGATRPQAPAAAMALAFQTRPPASQPPRSNASISPSMPSIPALRSSPAAPARRPAPPSPNRKPSPHKRSNSQRFKTILLVSLVLILLGQIVFLGWRWWKRSQTLPDPNPPKRSEQKRSTPHALARRMTPPPQRTNQAGRNEFRENKPPTQC